MTQGNSGQPAWLQRLGECVGHDHESMVSIVDGLLIEIPDMSRRLQQAIASENAAEVQRYAHTLKSSLNYVSTGPDVSLANRIETCGREQRISDASSLLEQLAPHVDQLQSQLQAWFDSQ